MVVDEDEDDDDDEKMRWALYEVYAVDVHDRKRETSQCLNLAGYQA